MMRHVALVAIALAGCGFTAGKPMSGDKVDAAVSADASGEPATDAPPMIDAAPDAPPAWTVVDTLMVPCSTAGATSTFVLMAGVMYKLRASGECVTNTANGSRGDAEYFGYNIGTSYDVFQDIDDGLAINDSTPGPTKNPRWGTESTTHDYEQMWTGAGAVIVATYHDTNYSNNSGSLKLQILALH